MSTRNNSERTQIPPEVLEQFMKQQEQKFVQQQPQPAVAPTPNINPVGYSVPTDFVDLPSRGKFYNPQHPWHNKTSVEVRFMTTREEDIITSPVLAQKGLIFDKLVESVCVDRVLAKDISPGDKAAILINCRKNAYGDEYTFQSICDNCAEVYDKTIKLSEIKNKEVDYQAYNITNHNTFVVETPLSKKSVEFKLFETTDEEFINLQIENRRKHNLPEEGVAITHRRLIVSVDGDNNPMTINSFVSSLLLKDSRYLQRCYVAVKPDLDLTYTHVCENCTHENEGGVPFGADFFWSDE